MIESAADLALWFSVIVISIVVLSFCWLDIYRPNPIDLELEEAERRLDMEEKRFRVGSVDRRNLAQ